MKTKNMIISGILSLILAVGIIVMISCKKEINEPTVPKDDNYAFANVGSLHNGALTYYYENRLKLKSSASQEEMVSELVDLTSEYLVKQGFDRSIVINVKQQVENSLLSNRRKNSSGNMFLVDTASFIEQINQQNMFSSEFIEEVNKLFALAHTDVDEVDLKDYVNNTFAVVQYSNQNDINAQQVYVDIFNSSYNYWLQLNVANTQKKSTLKLKPSTWVIINDGIGGVLGTAFGPVGSIVLGTALSAGTNEGL